MHYEEFNHFCWSKPVFEKSLKKNFVSGCINKRPFINIAFQEIQWCI